MNILYLIPARGGSKGIPGKNIKLLNGIPLIEYSIRVAQTLSDHDFICVSTDDFEIKAVAEKTGLNVPFLRPQELATDTAGSDDVILHALNYYEKNGARIELIVLLQPTSPFRTADHVKEALALYTGKEDMILGVKETKSNPYYILMEEDEQQYLQKSKKIPSTITRRQDMPKVYEVNGALYIIQVAAFKKFGSLSKFEKIKKYLMSEHVSIDIDTPDDWEYASFLMAQKK